MARKYSGSSREVFWDFTESPREVRGVSGGVGDLSKLRGKYAAGAREAFGKRGKRSDRARELCGNCAELATGREVRGRCAESSGGSEIVGNFDRIVRKARGKCVGSVRKVVGECAESSEGSGISGKFAESVRKLR